MVNPVESSEVQNGLRLHRARDECCIEASFSHAREAHDWVDPCAVKSHLDHNRIEIAAEYYWCSVLRPYSWEDC